MKACKRCGRTLSADAFGIDSSQLDGRNKYCKECRRDIGRKSRKNVAAGKSRGWRLPSRESLYSRNLCVLKAFGEEVGKFTVRSVGSNDEESKFICEFQGDNTFIVANSFGGSIDCYCYDSTEPLEIIQDFIAKELARRNLQVIAGV